jgi:ATP-binding protein involved in chromosome partitioning
VVAEPDSPIAGIYREVARKVAIKVADKARDMTNKFPSIVVQNT